MQANGAGAALVISTTRTPASGPLTNRRPGTAG
jgi:hypothetical protein